MRFEPKILPFLVWACAVSACDPGGSSGEQPLGGAPNGASGSVNKASSGAAGSTSVGGAATSGGGTTSGGTTSGGTTSGGTAGTTAATEGAFKLLFRDDFDQLDASRWHAMTHSWDTNLALFSSQSVTVEEGELRIRLLEAPAGTVDDSGATKRYLGAEVRSFDTLSYGRVRARLKFAKGPGVVSSLVTIYTPWPADDWNELDIECLGKNPSSVQLNTMVYTGAPTQPPVAVSVTPTAEPYKPTLDFDPSQDFHVYTIEWTPQSARFLVDDAVLYTWNKHIERLKLAQNVLLTIWASSSATWAGAVGEGTIGAEARYDWIELYRYEP